MPSRTVAFVKFFTEEAHADQFLKGSLFMRKLRYFQRLEASEADDGRPDAHEGVVGWHQPDQTELTISFPGFDPIKITGADLASPVAITRNVYSDMHIFCMSTVRMPDPAELSGDADEIKTQMLAGLRLDEQCLRFGPHAVVVDAGRFLARLREALGGLGHWYRADAVKYYDRNTFNGGFCDEQAPFQKQDQFEYQQEYRICLLTSVSGDEPMVFEVGDLSSFAVKMRSEDVNGGFRLSLKTPTP
jgi:hypothetical protein